LAQSQTTLCNERSVGAGAQVAADLIGDAAKIGEAVCCAD
jgi:hypothetical protein